MNKKLMVMLAGAVLMTGCANGVKTSENTAANTVEIAQTTDQSGTAAESSNDNAKAADPKATIDLSFKPNESGKIMVLMYHNIGTEEQEWVRTPENFLKDMNTLYEKGYRPISLSDYVKGNITTEQGYTPIVITFDDGNKNNFEYLEDGTLNKESAVGLLTAFHQTHKDFPLEATFFLTGPHPFNQKGTEADKVNFILENGMDVGNHTLNHVNFKKSSGSEAQSEIGAQAQFLKDLVKIEGYEINTFALPFGIRPKDENAKQYLAAGTYEGIPYENIAIVNVGWHPAFSPYDTRFDHTSIPRVRASEMKVDNVGMYNYLEYFDKHPEERFISDGVANVVTIPEVKKEFISNIGDKELYLYSPSR